MNQDLREDVYYANSRIAELEAQLAACQAELARERELLSMLHNVAGDYAFEQAESALELSKRAKE